MKKRIIAIVLVVAVVAASWVLYDRVIKRSRAAKAPSQTATGITTIKVTRGAIEATVDASGALSAERVQPLGFSIAGTVAEVLVKQGDIVKTGQILAKLDTTDLELSVKQAEASLQASEASLAKVRKGPTQESIAAAKAGVEAARASVADLGSGPTDQDKQLADLQVTQAQNSLAAAQASLQALVEGATDLDKQLAQLNVDQAKNSLWSAQGSRDSLGGQRGVTGGQKTSAEAAVSNAETAVTIAELNLKKLLQPPKAADLAAAQVQVANAQVALRTAQVNRDKIYQAAKSASVANAQSQLAQAESNLAQLLSSPTPEDVAAAEAQASQARVGVDIAKSRLTDAILVAPFDGEIAAWNLHVNDPVAAATQTGSITDLSHYHIDVSIDESQISQVAAGQKVRITLDAFPDASFEGTVSTVDTLGTTTQGIVNYNVRVDLAATDVAIKPGMTAGVSIVAQHKDNVLTVPNGVLKRDTKGTYVQVLRLGVPVRTEVTIGVANDQVTEILKGLSEGQEIVSSAPRTNPVGGGRFGGG
jgi:HlyD family secretion protein